MTAGIKIEELVATASVYAAQGEVSTTEYYLSLAQRYAGKKDISAIVTDVEKRCFKKACRFNLSRAREFARRGRIPVRDYCLSLAEEYARKIGTDISSQIAVIKATDYQKR